MLTIHENLETALESCTMVGITHGGIFHADEVLATVILERAFGDFGIVRVASVPENVPSQVIVYDIGYGAFDHHQPQGAGNRKNGVPYASAGLIWRAYGKAALKDTTEDKDNASKIWSMVDCRLVQGVDAVDCGVAPKNYQYGVISLSQIVSGFNPVWNSNLSNNQAFKKAAGTMSQVLSNTIEYAAGIVKAEKAISQAIDTAEQGILILPDFMPWREGVLRSANPKAEGINFVIYPSVRGGYNWQVVPKNMSTRTARKEVPTAWWGLAGKELQEVCGVPDATFCHRAGFIGGAQSLLGALAMVSADAAAIALNQHARLATVSATDLSTKS